MQPAVELMLNLARAPMAESGRERAAELLLHGIDWEQFFIAVARGEVEPLVLANLREYRDFIPPDIAQKAAKIEHDSRVLAVSRTLRLVSLVDKMSAARIETIVLKGPAAGISAFGDASFRSFADADLLLKREDLPTARELLTSLGYTPEYDLSNEAQLVQDQHALELGSADMKVELHWALLSRHLRMPLDPASAWATARMIPCGNSEIRSLATPEMFFFLCAHGTKHEWSRLRWVCDVAQMAERLNDEEARAVVELAARVRGQRILALAVHTCEAILGPLSSPLVPMLNVSRQETSALVKDVERRLGFAAGPANSQWASRLDPGFSSLVFWARSRERRADRVACIARVLFVPTDKDAGRGAVRWITRPVRLAVRAVRHVVSPSSQVA